VTHPPDWRPLEGSPGFYVAADDSLHIDVAEALKANGYRPTRANVAALEQAVRDMSTEIGAEYVVHDE
jgi:hypothetical protein